MMLVTVFPGDFLEVRFFVDEENFPVNGTFLRLVLYAWKDSEKFKNLRFVCGVKPMSNEINPEDLLIFRCLYDISYMLKPFDLELRIVFQVKSIVERNFIWPIKNIRRR